MLNMYKQITIKTLNKQGASQTKIAGSVGCHRNTVRNILKRNEVVEKQTRSKSSYFDKYRELIKGFLDQKYTRVRIYEILTEEYGINRTYDCMCKYIQINFPKSQEAFGVQTTQPGEEAEIDFGYLGLQPSNDGNKSRAYVFSVKLSYSRKEYHEITDDQKISSVLKGLKNAFEYFGGVPTKLKVDNMRTAILKNQHYDLQFNQDLLEFAYHYGIVIKPCPPYKPNQKGKVESCVKYVKNNFLIGRSFTSRVDMQKQLRAWTDTYANKRIHGTTKRIPDEVFGKYEKSKLQKLPENDFTFFDRGTRVVKRNCHINFKANYYSVPSKFVGKNVCIRWTDNILRIIYEAEEIAVHKISQTNAGQYITQRSHMPDYKCYSETEYQAKYESKMVEIGEYAHDYFKEILLTKGNYWFRTVRGILGLASTYGNQRVNLTLKRAIAFGVTDLTTIRSICEKQTYLMDIQPKLLKTKEEKTDLTRDPSYYNQIYLN